MKKTFVLSLSALVLAACGNGNQDNTGTSEETDPASDNDTTEEVDRNQELIIYTNAYSDGRGEWLEAEAEEAGFNISIVGGGGADIASRLVSEANNPIADLVYGLNSMFYEQLKEAEAIQEFVPEWAEEVTDGINDPEGYYHGLVTQALLLSYNPNLFDENTAPNGYLDLVENEEYHGQYESATQLDQATSRIILSSILVQYQDTAGELGISDEGWDVIDRFINNGAFVSAGEDFYSLFASEEIPIGTLVSGTLQAKEEQYGVPAEFNSPEDIGSPSIVEHVAIINGTEKTALAEDFVNWFGSSEVQGQFASEFNSMPANEVAAEQSTDYVQDLYANITLQELDWGFISEYIDEWMEKIELEIL